MRPDQGRDTFHVDRRNDQGGNMDQRDGGRRRGENRWGPPAGGPKSLMDVNVNKSSSPNQNQFRSPRPGGGPTSHGGPPTNQGTPPPWMNQQRGPRPMMQGQGPPQGGPPQSNNTPPPWQQGPPRGA